MFELPNAKRVKRSKLFTASSSSDDEAKDAHNKRVDGFKDIESSSTKTKSKSGDKQTNNTNDDGKEPNSDEIQVDYGFEYDFIDKTLPDTATDQQDPSISSTQPQTDTIHEEEPKEQTFAFNLFAPKPKSLTTQTSRPHNPTTTPPIPDPPELNTNRITIRSPTPPSTTPKTYNIQTPRPQSHYFTSSLPTLTISTLKSQYADSALSGNTILARSTLSWPGTHLPWRVITILSTVTQTSTSQNPKRPATTTKSTNPNPKTRPRTRPSKKRRIQHRQRLQARHNAKLAGQAAEEADREKRTRRNREKKVKRKMREKAKKLESGVPADLAEDGTETTRNGEGVDSDSS